MARKDPALAFCFRVTITKSSLGVNLDKASGLFKSVSGLGVETEVVDFKEGGVNDMTHKLVGGAKYKNIVLKRGVVGPEVMDPVYLHHAHSQRAFGLTQYQALHTLSLGLTKQDSLPSHSWPDPIRT